MTKSPFSLPLTRQEFCTLLQVALHEEELSFLHFNNSVTLNLPALHIKLYCTDYLLTESEVFTEKSQTGTLPY